MKIALLGGGFASLATAWQLLQYTNTQIELFDPNGIGGGASGLDAALLHPFAGPHSKLNPLGWAGMLATRELLDIAAQEVGPVAEEIELLRPALTADQKVKFAVAASQNADTITWLTEEETQKRLPGLAIAPGIVIQKSMVVFAKSYLKGLWQACQKKGAVIHHMRVSQLEDLGDFDAIVAALGADCQQIPALSHLSLSLVKGQQLELEWPAGLPPLPLPINSQLYCLMSREKTSCYIGSTFERNYTTRTADITTASQLLLPKLKELYPPLQAAKVIGCHVGVRVSTPNRLPLIQKVAPKTWVYTGLASKGLLYHALYAKELAKLIALDLNTCET